MKPKLLVHPSQARTIGNPVEIERLLGMGWVIAAPKAKTRMAKAMRELRAQRRAAGWQSLLLFLPPEQLAMVKAALLQGESYAELLIRLVRKQSLL
ncbi:hypothetical protein V0R52_12695 [Pseudomonas asiatica]|uniref:hypothetical protein n=1 Tax=Pseudomonas TaxID=286 RepID=UPI002554340F|nr:MULTISPECIES: hypothetical protein [Pseudomonas]MDM9552977.1 hypothetical protein [Pseudomonas asiatica]MEE1917255.1 hypothetical protein [Pseudomonas asiatica]WIV23054.1 hypothetical protein QN085_20620 [Pseudomonas sp. M2(2023)]